MEPSSNNINPSVIGIPLRKDFGSYGLEAPRFLFFKCIRLGYMLNSILRNLGGIH